MTHGLGHQATLDGEVFFKLVDHQNILIIIGDGGIVQLFLRFLPVPSSLTRLSIIFIVAVAADLVRGGQADLAGVFTMQQAEPSRSDP